MNGPAPRHAVLIVGIGSHHGDDRFGWEVVDRLATLGPGNADDGPTAGMHGAMIALRKLTSPAELLNHLHGIRRLVICDACHGLSHAGEHRLLTWPTDRVDHLTGSGSHDFSLVNTLHLADKLNMLPLSVDLWVAEKSREQVLRRSIHTSLSPALAKAVEVVACKIEGEFVHA